MDLIRNALETICNNANIYLKNLESRDDDWITLTSLVDHNGALNPAARDKIVMCIYNITKETIVNTYQRNYSSEQIQRTQDAFSVVNPPIYIDIHLMFMANLTEIKYKDGLSILSRLISFFQQTAFFTRDNAPQLAPEIDKLTLEFENLNPVDVNYVMSMLGTRYLPSAFYKMRMLPFASTAMIQRSFPVSAAQTLGSLTPSDSS